MMDTISTAHTAGGGNGSVLIVDDEPANVRLLEHLLARAGYTRVQSTTDSREVAPRFADFQPDIVLLDLHMPYLDGFAVMEQLRSLIPERSFVPIVVLTADISPAARQQALAMGAKDFLTKPFNPIEVLLRIKNLLETRALHLQLQDQNRLLEQRVRERTRELEAAYVDSLERLALAAEYRDDETGQHTRRVGETSARLARALGLPHSQVEFIRYAAPLHDVGKIAIPDAILRKPGRLTVDEFEQMKAHAIIGASLLADSGSPLLRLAEEIARSHHQRWDGSGYPAGAVGDAIPLAGRIVAIADVFDALTHERPYKPAWAVDEALAEIERQRSRQFDPRVAEAFLHLMERQPAATAFSQPSASPAA